MDDARRLGFVSDAEFDEESGGIRAVVVPKTRFFGLIRTGEYVIPWEHVVCSGKDVLLVSSEE